MKISKLFHWLYATLMFLPLIALPIFGIYSHRHTIDSGSIQVPQNKVVDFNQVFNNGSTMEIRNCEVDYLNLDYYVIKNVGGTEAGGNVYGGLLTTSTQVDHIYYFDCIINNSTGKFSFPTFGPYDSVTFTADTDYHLQYRNTSLSSTFWFYPFGIGIDVPEGYECTFKKAMLFDLTQMFGSGNEPSIQQFNAWYTSDYYSYTLSRKELIKDYSTITYDDTDIMSQFAYQTYNLEDKYLNFDNVFGFGNVYDWLQLNIFNGTPSIYFTMFWHLLTYWLIVSLFWLVFDVLMYVPQLAHRWLDRGAIE